LRDGVEDRNFDLPAALARALAAGARAATEMRVEAWDKIVVLADPFRARALPDRVPRQQLRRDR